MRNHCTIGNCTRPVHGHGMCGLHYLRWYNHGDPTHERPIITQCRIEDCHRPPRSKSNDLCEMHYYRARRHGDPLTVINTRRADSKYRAAHTRIARDRGTARDHQCVDCGRQAHHWSYTHTDSAALISDTGQPYSLDPNHYEPRCASCHAAFDGTGANQYRQPH